MPLDPNKLSRNELVQLVNSTSLGECLTRGRLNSQMNRAGRRWHDGRHVRLLDYLRWLTREVERPARPRIDGRTADLARKNTETWRSQNVAPVPDVADWQRRQAACVSFKTFCETYFPQVFYRPWSADHLRVIAKIERCILEGGLFAFAMPRGSGKTAMASLGGLWAVLVGARPFVCLIGGAKDTAQKLLANIRATILSPQHETFRADFPEALYPLWMLRNNARRQGGQHLDGELTCCTWGHDHLVFPTVTGERLPKTLREEGLDRSPSSGSIIAVTSLDANMRGQQHTTMDGNIIRPSLVFLDDPQTRESARSAVQTSYRMSLLQGDVLGMAGPGEKIAAFLACTKMYEGDLADQVLDRKRCPQWQGECTKLIYAWPTNEKLWDQYVAIRSESLRQGNAGKEATEFYQQHQAEMDAGSAVAWGERFNSDELSAVQHAINLKCDMGNEAFSAEYQNEPAAQQESDVVMLTPVQVAARFNGRQRGEVPLACTKLTGFIDVHKEVLYWCVCAWQDDFTGFVIDYNTLPDQRRNFFTLANAARTLGLGFPGMGEDGALQAGMEKLVAELLAREWPKAGGGVFRLERLLVDMGYKPGLAAAIKHKVGGSGMWLSNGVGIRAGSKPISMYQRRPGWTLGHNWYVPNVAGTHEFPHVCVDVNSWKSFVHERLGRAAGDPGAMTLFGRNASEHLLFAEHIAGSETYVPTTGHGRQVQEWRQRPERPDNHWFDCLVGCAAAASLIGVKVAGEASPERPRKRMLTQADFQRRW